MVGEAFGEPDDEARDKMCQTRLAMNQAVRLDVSRSRNGRYDMYPIKVNEGWHRISDSGARPRKWPSNQTRDPEIRLAEVPVL